jgi:hypothetical protein
MKKGTFFDYPHPEAKEDEMFITNATVLSYDIVKWKTKRRGINAYDQNGKHLPQMFPVFAKREEVEAVRTIVKR